MDVNRTEGLALLNSANNIFSRRHGKPLQPGLEEKELANANSNKGGFMTTLARGLAKEPTLLIWDLHRKVTILPSHSQLTAS
jgi:hypothetical protein